MVKNKIASLLLGMALTLGAAGMAVAQTAAGTPVSNTITLSYNTGAGTINVAAGDLPTETFTVDRKIDLTLRSTLASTAEVTAPGGTTQALLAFELTNNGNGTQDFSIAVTQPAGDLTLTAAGTPTATPAAGEYSVLTNSSAALAGATPLTGDIDDLAASGNIFILVVANIPVAATDNTFDVFTVTATALTEAGGTITYTRLLGLDAENVIAVDTAATSTLDASSINTAEDGIDADQARLRVATPVIVARKTVAVISEDPAFDCTDIDAAADAPNATAGAIPGACLEYTIEVENTSTTSAAANDIAIADALPSEVTYASDSDITYTGTAGGATTTQPANTSGTVSAEIGTLPAGTTATFTIRVTVD